MRKNLFFDTDLTTFLAVTLFRNCNVISNGLRYTFVRQDYQADLKVFFVDQDNRQASKSSGKISQSDTAQSFIQAHVPTARCLSQALGVLPKLSCNRWNYSKRGHHGS